jgi:type II secretory pathway component GspD/PulD (secretin)
MTGKVLSRTLLASVCTLGLLLSCGMVLSQQDKAPDKSTASPDKKAKVEKGTGGVKDNGDKKEARSAKTQIKVFELKNLPPDQMRQTLSTVWAPVMEARGIRSAAGPMGGLQLVANPRNHTLFARGTEKELAIIEELVQMFDVADGQNYPQAKGFTIVRLRHVRAPEVMQVLTGLSLQSKVVSLPGQNALLLLEKGDDDSEIRTVIEKLDQPEKKKETVRNSPPAQKK